MITPDDVCNEYAERPVRLQPTDLGEVVLIEGTRESLEVLAKLLAAQATAADDGFEISPRGPGSYFFDPASEKGFYIHRKESEGTSSAI